MRHLPEDEGLSKGTVDNSPLLTDDGRIVTPNQDQDHYLSM